MKLLLNKIIRKGQLYFLVICVLLSLSCKKSAESVIDCLGESLLGGVHITTDDTNEKLIHLEARYHGSHTVSSVSWDYGDGTMTKGSEKTSDHTYLARGVYTVTAKITIVNNGTTCEVSPKKTVTIN